MCCHSRFLCCAPAAGAGDARAGLGGFAAGAVDAQFGRGGFAAGAAGFNAGRAGFGARSTNLDGLDARDIQRGPNQGLGDVSRGPNQGLGDVSRGPNADVGAVEDIRNVGQSSDFGRRASFRAPAVNADIPQVPRAASASLAGFRGRGLNANIG